MEECKPPARHHQLHPRRLSRFFIHPSGPYTRSFFIFCIKAKEVDGIPALVGPLYMN